ncbi:MAG: hypothetical protein Q9178_004937 [Gyalolechia marmorata]
MFEDEEKDAENEVEVINSIYGENTLKRAPDVAPGVYLLAIPQKDVTLRLSIPNQYPSVSLQITAVESVGPATRKGYGTRVLNIAREVVQKVLTPGQVCIFNLLQDLEQRLDQESATEHEQLANHSYAPDDDKSPPDKVVISDQNDAPNETANPPQWTLSATVTEKKSVFIARACAIQSTSEAQVAMTHLLSTDKRASKATHNISAYRIRTLVNGHEVTYQDGDDDGEDAAGGRLLKLLQMMDVWNALVVVSQWYGGVKLGPARFGIINAVARDAVVAGGFAKDPQPHR